ncbi:MAG: hypothetical protein KDD33_13240, partial [Bdellovibrionales bacterium]|nr:hypothetical protein [Bdellovibrionales bacterium]
YVGSKVSKGKLNEATLDVVAVGVDGKAYTNMLDLELAVKKVNTIVVGEKVFGGLIQKVFERELLDTQWENSCSLDDSVAKCPVGALDAGHYVLQVASKTTGQKTYSTFKVDKEGMVTGENDYFYFDESDKGFPVAADKADYKGGEVAKLTFESPFAECVGLITLERSDVVETIVDAKACENGYVMVPVRSENAPNIFTSIYLVTGRADDDANVSNLDLGKPTYGIGFANLKIDWSKYAVDVKVTMDKDEYKPGEYATANIEVAAQEGDLMNSEVTLVVIEEKILELKKNDSYKILESMMGLRTHNVGTINNMQFLTSASKIAKPILAKDEAGLADEPKAGEEGGSGSEFEAFQRKLFDSLVAWRTGVPVINGQAQVQFKLNDKLAKFKVFAVINDMGQKFGTGSSNYVAMQEVQTFSNLAPVTRTGDQFPIMVNLQNNGQSAGKFTVIVDYTITDVNGKQTVNQVAKVVDLDSGSSTGVKVGDLQVPENAKTIDYTIVVKDENGLVVDSLKPEAQKVSPAVPLSVQDEYLVQMDKDELELVLTKNKQAIADRGKIAANVFSSLVKSTEFSIQESMGKDPFANLTVENQLLTAVVMSSSDDSAKLDAAFAELASLVDANGFMKYFKGADTGSFWLTAEMLQLVAMKPWAVDKMPKSLKSKFINAMNSVLDGTVDPKYIALNPTDFQWMVAKLKASNAMYAMNEEAAMASTDDLVALANADTDYTSYPLETLVDVALLNAQRSPETLLKSNVMTYIQESLLSLKNTSAMLKGQAEFGWWGYGDEVVGTAKLVKALSLVGRSTGTASSENYLDNYVRGLVQANKLGQWYTNRTKAWVLTGLSAFAETYESEKVSGTSTLSNSESSVATTVIWGSSAQEENGVETSWKSDKAIVKVNHNGQGQPWVSVIAESAVELKQPNYQGLQVTKAVKNLTRQDGTFQTGDLLQVEVSVTTPSAQPHVVLFDPIPSGANILSEGWGAFSLAQKSYSGYQVYFAYLPAGTATVTYQYQLNNPGTYNVSPTRAEAVYEPGLFGEIPNATMTVAE